MWLFLASRTAVCVKLGELYQEQAWTPFGQTFNNSGLHILCHFVSMARKRKAFLFYKKKKRKCACSSDAIFWYQWGKEIRILHVKIVMTGNNDIFSNWIFFKVCCSVFCNVYSSTLFTSNIDGLCEQKRICIFSTQIFDNNLL